MLRDASLCFACRIALLFSRQLRYTLQVKSGSKIQEELHLMRKASALIIAGLIMIGCAFSAAADGGDWKQACRETLETTYADAGQEEDSSLSAMPLYAL